MATQQKKPPRRFPRKLGRFINLEGGLYGTLDIVAITCDALEFQTGEDFIRFDRAQATNLRETIDKFLAFDRDDDVDASVEALVIEEIAADVTRPKRARHRKSA